MLTAEGCRARQKRLWDRMDPAPEFIVLGAPRHITYFSGYYSNPFSYASQNAPALLILGSDASSKLVVDNVQRRLTNEARVDEVLEAAWADGRHSANIRANRILELALGLIDAGRSVSVGLDCGVPAQFIERLNLSAAITEPSYVDQLILDLGRAKEPDELDVIRRSIRAIEAGYEGARAGIHAGMSEMEAYTLVHKAAAESAGQPVIVYGDFASGPRTESGGGGPTERIIEKGDLFILDYSVVIHGYRGDLCSTWVVDGEPSARQKEISELCLEAIAAGEAMLRPGVQCCDLDSAVRDIFRPHGLVQYFKHHTGHGIGLGHPDAPYIVPESSESLVVGDVITLEPGCYIPGIGGMRFEHNYLITDSGFERLSGHQLRLYQ